MCKSLEKLSKYFNQKRVSFFSHKILEIDNLDISLKIIIVPHNPVDSRADFKLNIRATEMKSDKAYSSEYTPGHYNITSSLKLTQLDNSR